MEERIASEMAGMKGWLTDVTVKGAAATLLFRLEKGKQIITRPYQPYFYIVCNEPELVADLIGKHPLVSSASVEKKFATLWQKKPVEAVKVCPAVSEDMERVVRDCNRLPGVQEIAETSVPHYFRHMLDRKLDFFRYYDLESMEEIGNGEMMPELEIAVAEKAGNAIRVSFRGKGKAGGAARPCFASYGSRCALHMGRRRMAAFNVREKRRGLFTAKLPAY